jgi:hypothetical protein
MPKGANAVKSRTVRATVSEQSENFLRQLVLRGVYGRTVAEVAGRFIDQALLALLDKPQLVLPGERKGKAK